MAQIPFRTLSTRVTSTLLSVGCPHFTLCIAVILCCGGHKEVAQMVLEKGVVTATTRMTLPVRFQTAFLPHRPPDRRLCQNDYGGASWSQSLWAV